jgi:hypothetical protein
VIRSRANLALFLVLLLSPGCAVRTRDYRFGITGVVTSEDGTPIENADISLDVFGPVYSGVATVRTQHLETDNSGGFVVMHTSHRTGVKYTLTVQKPGFQTEKISGNAPPDQHHKIPLKRVSTQNSKY